MYLQFSRITKVVKSVGALALNARKYGSSCFKRSKVWELSLYMLKGVGFIALDAQEYGSSRVLASLLDLNFKKKSTVKKHWLNPIKNGSKQLV